MNKQVLASAIEVVAFLFAAFGGYFTAIAPPEDAAQPMMVGFVSLLALCVLLFVAVMARRRMTRSRRRTWLITAGVAAVIALLSGLRYVHSTDRLTFRYPPETPMERYVAGTEFTDEAGSYAREHPSRTTAEIVADFQGPRFRERVWVPDSIRSSRLQLSINYTTLVLSFSIAIFCLSEGLLVHSPSNKTERKTARRSATP
jgi:TRAP-type uncharacterized transport system fused permease subunit